jgi:hypothetical protein
MPAKGHILGKIPAEDASGYLTGYTDSFPMPAPGPIGDFAH